VLAILAQTPQQKLMNANTITTSIRLSHSSPKTSPQKLKAPSAETILKKASALMTRSASSPMALNSFVSIWRRIVHIRQKVVMLLRRKDTAATGSAAISSTSGRCARMSNKNGRLYTIITDRWWKKERRDNNQGYWNWYECEWIEIWYLYCGC
jgi:hypothetical protein